MTWEFETKDVKSEAEEKPIPITKPGPTSDIMSLKIKIPINQNKIKKKTWIRLVFKIRLLSVF